MNDYYIYNRARNKFWRQHQMGYTLDMQESGFWPEHQLIELMLEEDDEKIPANQIEAKYLEALKLEVARRS